MILLSLSAAARGEDRVASAEPRAFEVGENGVVSAVASRGGAALAKEGGGADGYGGLRLAPVEPDAATRGRGARRSAACAPSLTPAEVSALVRQIAREERLNEGLAEAMADAESGLGRDLVSAKGAVGIMQLMAATGVEYGVADRCSPEQNVRAGVRYMRDLLKRYDDNVVLALAAYNAGPERVKRAKGAPLFPETTKYVVSILNRWRGFKVVPTSDAPAPGAPQAPAGPGVWVDGHVINME